MSERIETVEAESFCMDYLRFGRGEEPLVILPGASVQSVMGAADAVMEAYAPLADDFTVYLLDYRRSFPDPYLVHDMARDAFQVLRALGLERTCVFGASLGGMVAMTLAIDHPRFVQKLALGSTAARMPEGNRRLFSRWASLALAGDAKELYLSFGEALYPPNVFEPMRGQLQEAAETVSADDLARFAIMMRSVLEFNAEGELGKICCPVLAIGSSDDRVLGAEGTLQIADALGARPTFEMHLYDNYGHASYDTAPDYKDRLLKFFSTS